ncbi:unnamed protein product [Callosobruchus maculatus]|uniref:Uncharacterized protein n=1 Tax=Callosobruchus maculatus TaxID=64391 RepID=A0A653D2A4_CALMS|nr:unnamed protein product [Callosobruchus maculatus]
MIEEKVLIWAPFYFFFLISRKNISVLMEKWQAHLKGSLSMSDMAFCV